ncbi:hypothetical protein B0T22DRAFT_458247 [Podospora appendiculata]|uniref:Ankyrin repeat protein n=1 Tax=Podospora appendiculata TaxID=314037 RepID=A0AAE0X8S2_9PEZI|nr:hypothetical protein B0T22DRAFT_458247 [Podospora appendiculata]
MHWAAAKGRMNIMEVLVKTRKSAVLDRCETKHSAPLHWASGYGFVEAVEYLLDKGLEDHT